jgi:3-oxoacyl-[acyl-carrier protein] reductase
MDDIKAKEQGLGPALEGKVAVVTGAGAGIGEASALLFAAEGASVVVNDQDAETAAETVAAIRAQGGRAVAEVGDVSRRETVEACVDRALSEWGQLDVMLNNAATAIAGFVHELTDAQWRREQ